MSNSSGPGKIEARAPDADPSRPQAMSWDGYHEGALAAWKALLDTDPEEPVVHAFLEKHPAMIPGGSGDIGPGGHHGSTFGAVFSKPTLKGQGRDFLPDFMWVTRSTSLITPILIEIEKPSKPWFRRDGRPSTEFVHAHDQLNDWRSWFAKDANKGVFRSTFMLGDEKFEDRPVEPYFVLIHGRSSEFEPGARHTDPAALRAKRDSMRLANESFMTFDSLVPNWKHRSTMSISMTATGPQAIALSPVYGTTTEAGAVARAVRGIPAAVDDSTMMSDERKAYLKGRFEHWVADDAELERRGIQLRLRSTGLE